MQITLNNKVFTNSDEEFINSLFNLGGTCSGYFRTLKNKINLYDMQKNLIGVITKNKVLAKATLLDSKYWYSYGNVDIIGEYASYKQAQQEITTALQEAGIL